MSKKREARFDLYKLTTDTCDKEVVDVFKLKSSEYKPQISEGYPIILYSNFTEDEHFIMGTLLLQQNDNLPPIIDFKTKRLSELDLEKTQGLAHPTSFLYDKELNFLMYETYRGSIPLSSFIHFFEQNTKTILDAEFVLEPNSMIRYNALTTFTKFEVKIASIPNGKGFGEAERAIKDINNLTELSNSSKINITMLSTNQRPLSMKFIKNIVSYLRPFGKENKVEKLIVSGKTLEQSRNIPINLLNERIRIKFLDPLTRYISPVTISSKLQRMRNEYIDARTKFYQYYKPKRA